MKPTDFELTERVSQALQSWPMHYRLLFLGLAYVETQRGKREMDLEMFFTLCDDLEVVLKLFEEVEEQASCSKK